MIHTYKLKDIVRLNIALKMILNNNDLGIDQSLKFKLLGVMKDIETPVANFENARVHKVKEYGKENKDGDFSISKDDIESMKKFKNDIDNILDSNVEVDIHKLKPNDVFDKGLSTDFLMALYPIITE